MSVAFIPIILLFIMWGIKRGEVTIPKSWESWKLWAAIFLITQAIILGELIWTQILGHSIPTRGLISTMGLAVSLGLFLMWQYSSLGQPTAAFLGIMGICFYVGALEIPYQIAGYQIIWGQWTSLTDHTLVIIEQLCFMIPFIVATTLYSIKPTRVTLYGLITWLAIFTIWIWGFHFWSIGRWVGTEHTMELNTPINWYAYFMNKLYVVTFTFIVIGFRIKEKEASKEASYDWDAFKSLNPLRLWWKRKVAHRVWGLSKSRTLKTLDIGCGSSQIITYYSQAIGIDCDAKKAEFMQKKGIDVRRMDAENLEFEDGNFDLVLCLSTIEHVKNPSKVISEISRVLQNKGQAIIVTPDTSRKAWNIIWKIYSIVGGHYRETHSANLTLPKLESMANEHKLNLVYYEYVIGCDLICVFNKEAR